MRECSSTVYLTDERKAHMGKVEVIRKGARAR